MHELPEPSGRRFAAFVGASLRRAAKVVLCIALVFSIVTAMPPSKNAGAQVGCDNLCACEAVFGITTIIFAVLMHQTTRNWVEIQFELHREIFMIEYFFYEFLMKSMMLMDTQLTSAAMMQVAMIGGFFDASQQLKSQRLMQQLAAQAHRDYHPSMDMCALGTAARKLGAASAHIDANAAVVSAHQRARQLHTGGVIGTEGSASDKRGRMMAIIGMYCDINDNNNEDAIPGDGLEPLCGAAQPGGSLAAFNEDMSVSLRGDKPREEMSVISGIYPEKFTGLVSNLFAPDLIPPIPEALIMPAASDPFKNEGNRQTLLDIRAIAAKRSVAEYSFSSVAASKMEGSAESDAPLYMATIIELIGKQPTGAQGTSAQAAADFIGQAPSYHAIMDVLTKKIYFDQNFYVGLYDTPANVARKGAAMRAIALMQNMDMLKSQLRKEMSLSVAVELEIDKLQEKIDNRLKGLTTEGEPRR
ncbi:MAG: hypothetical protein HY370_07590 [Proteobacteria bacterium]|nr:hypothetical protein [Pseudomonadota bacterium]